MSQSNAVDIGPANIRGWLSKAVARFNRIESASLLCPARDEYGKELEPPRWGGASERAIAHRLAVLIEIELCRNWQRADYRVAVDCEYNRHLQREKVHRIPSELVKIVEHAKRTVRPVSDDDSWFVFSIFPDIIIHERGSDNHNLLVVELKKDSNAEIAEYDDLKLTCFTDQTKSYKYLVGAKVTAHDTIAPEKRHLEVSQWYGREVAAC